MQMKTPNIYVNCILWLYFSSSLVFASKCHIKVAVEGRRINCTESGKIVSCMPGWTGDECNVPACQASCHPTHGYCTKPGECKCALGWRGKNCDECVPLPGCKQGFCKKKSYDCICKPGWKGTYCSTPVCRKGCHSSRGYCKLPGECRCRIGWGGETCNLCRPLPGCKNGYCTKPLECLCKKGWEGMHCDKPICQETCSKEHGSCTKPGQCRCDVGWWGSTCKTCFPYPGCKHGHCNKPWECICDTGWRGMKCDEEFRIGQSYCHTHSNPCRNGGKCIDMDEDQTYTCACNPLYTGEHCDFITKPKPFYFPIFPRSSHRWKTSLPNVKLIPRTKIQNFTTTSQKPETITEIITVADDSTWQEDQLDLSSLKDEVKEPLQEIGTSFSTEISVVTEPYFNDTIATVELSEDAIKEDIIAKTTMVPVIEITTPVEKILIETPIQPQVEASSDNDISIPIQPQVEVSSDIDDSIPNIEEQFNSEVPEQKQIMVDVPIIQSQPSITTMKGKRNFKKGSKFRSDVTIKKKVSPILYLQLRSPTKPFYNPLGDDQIKNTDANSPRANLITKRRYVRYNRPSNSPNSRQSGPAFPFASRNQLGPRTSRSKYPVNSIDPVILESIIQNSNIRSIIPARLTRRFQQKNISAKEEYKGTDPLQYFSSQEDYEALQASSPAHTRGISKRKRDQSYHLLNYNGRVHIGDTAEFDEHSLNEILQAFIELKRISR